MIVRRVHRVVADSVLQNKKAMFALQHAKQLANYVPVQTLVLSVVWKVSVIWPRCFV